MEQIDKILNRIKKFSENCYFDSCKPELDAKEALSLSKEDLHRLSSDECYEYAFTLTTYQFFLHQRLSERECELDWCNFTINRVLGDEWDNYDKFLPSEARIASIINGNSFLKVVEEARRLILERTLLIKGKLEIVGQKVKLLEIMGKRKQYR